MGKKRYNAYDPSKMLEEAYQKINQPDSLSLDALAKEINSRATKMAKDIDDQVLDSICAIKDLTYGEIVEIIENSILPLSEWESNFLDSIKIRIDAKLDLSDKQKETLNKIFKKMERFISTNGPYALLEINDNATLEEINDAYDRISESLDPDKLAKDGYHDDLIEFAERKLEKVSKAYEMLVKMHGEPDEGATGVAGPTGVVGYDDDEED